MRLAPSGQSPDGRTGPGRNVWYEVAVLDEHRVGVIIGNPTALGSDAGLRAAVSTTLRETADPLRALDCVSDQLPAVTALCAVIDRTASRLAYSTIGQTAPVVAAPQVPHRVLDRAPGRVAVGPLPAGATVLLCNVVTGEIGDEMDLCTELAPEQAADRLIAPLTPTGPDVVAVVYRHPPAPLTVTVPAEPASLAIVRGRLRQWLALAGADPECSADTLLAVGEATSNSTEHSVTGVEHAVQITVQASIDGERLHFTVSDNGCWKPAAAAPGYRGHGIRLINALVDASDLTATEHGTTVEMIKEL